MKKLFQNYLLFAFIIGFLIEMNGAVYQVRSVKLDAKKAFKNKNKIIDRKNQQQYLNGIWNRIGKRAEKMQKFLEFSKTKKWIKTKHWE